MAEPEQAQGTIVGGGPPADVIAAGLVTVPSARTLGALAGIDPVSISPAEQIDLLVALDRHASWVASVRARAMAAVAGQDPRHDGASQAADATQAAEADGGADPFVAESFTADPFRVEDPVREEVAVALAVSGVAAGNQIAVARDLGGKLAGTAAMLAVGSISYAHAAALSDECDRLTPGQARQVEQAVLALAAGKTPGQVRRHARRVAARIAPLPAAEELDAEFARREVTLYSDGGVMATIVAELPAPDAIAVWNALTACGLADARAHDTRTLAHKRADALTDWAHLALDNPDVPRQQGRKRLETQVVIDLATLLGFAHNPGELVGYGPIPARLARDLAADSQWRRLVVDPVTGHLLDYGTSTYTPLASLREFVITRDRTCQFPGCSQPASRTDLDHMIAFTGTDDGGSTSAANLHCLCRRHHKLKTHYRWRVTHNERSGPDTDQVSQPIAGGPTWTSPRGKQYTTDPPRQLDTEPDHVELARERSLPHRPAVNEVGLNEAVPDEAVPGKHQSSGDCTRHTKFEVTLEQLILAA